MRERFGEATPAGLESFRRFPKDEERRKIWEIKIRRENFKATKSSRLCSKHFSPDSFDIEKFGGTWLKKTAVPTVFNFHKHVVERKITRKPLVRKTPELEPVIEQELFASPKRQLHIATVRVPGSEPNFTEDPPSVWAWCTLILPSSVKSPPAGVVQKLGEEVELRCCHPHLTEVEIYEFYSIP
ncbi:hypothetical protein AVEN_248900-1 [Araneus ventricosus]|uniref:THAP-type domain-containing protein n=1 Tax=Araneus ventricosus TaxID=182803 RepID=A0A4Y2NJE4_ARAVE|nr:hypothetical protein AVEN_248900-1 [Araneus ventricosus]